MVPNRDQALSFGIPTVPQVSSCILLVPRMRDPSVIRQVVDFDAQFASRSAPGSAHKQRSAVGSDACAWPLTTPFPLPPRLAEMQPLFDGMSKAKSTG